MLFHSHPLVHLITNPVTMHKTVNGILACGGRAICAEDAGETEEITALSDALVLNTGIPSAEKLDAMLLSGKQANAMGIPVVLDPVGAGASRFRSRILSALLSGVRFTVIRGNESEIAALCQVNFRSGGVEDAGVKASQESLRSLSRSTGAVVIATGAADRVVYGEKILTVTGGSALQKQVTGSGCMLSGLLAAALADARDREDPAAGHTAATVHADGSSARDTDFRTAVRLLSQYKQAAEEAEIRMRSGGFFGTMTYEQYLTDALSRMGRPHWSRDCLALYAITDRRWLNGRSLTFVTEQALQGGATMVQLREKSLDEASLAMEAAKLLPLCHRYGVPLIINDNIDVCRRTGADGVHLGQNDTSVREARQILGPEAVIGATAHSIDEAVRAEAEGADYIGSGAAFGSSTKKDAVSIDPAEYRKITDAVQIPVVAIGGIHAGNILQLQGLGLAGVAVVSGIFAADDIREAAKTMRKLSDSIRM